MEITRPTVMEVDLNAFEHNIKQIKDYVGANVKIMPVIKANAYGTWINRRLDIIEKFEIVAVATVDEAVELRKIGFKNEIFVLNQPFIDEVEKIIKYNISIGISSNEFLKELGKHEEKVSVHIEIGTGMGRTGIHPKRVSEYIDLIKKYKNVCIEGIYTHLSSADIDKEYTEKQLASFENAVKVAESLAGPLKYIHASASNGIINFKQSYYNLVRPGIILYGYQSAYDTFEKIDLKPVCKLKSKITLIKTVKEGTSIGYSRSYITNRETRVATIPIGYADGLRRNLSNKGYVIINGKKVPIIGNICMDGFMADITELDDVKVGDDVYIWDNEIITLEEIAQMCGTINYEIMCTISERVPRIFI